jgi:hypothetical protein
MIDEDEHGVFGAEKRGEAVTKGHDISLLVVRLNRFERFVWRAIHENLVIAIPDAVALENESCVAEGGTPDGN